MPRSEPTGVDWRAWIALAWVVVFGVLYTRTVVEQRGPKIRAALGLSTPGTVRR